MRWVSVEERLPPLAKRVLVMLDIGTWMPGRLVIEGRWISDDSRPIRHITHWLEVVSPDETAL